MNGAAGEQGMVGPVRKVALVGDWFLPHRGGIEVQMHDLAQQLMARGCEVQVFTPVPGPAAYGALRVHRLPGLRAPQFGFVCTPTPFRALEALLRRERPDVVHCHASYIAPAAFGGAYVCQKLGLPTVITFHSALLHFNHVLAALDRRLHWSAWPVVFSEVSPHLNREIERLVAPRPLRVLPNAVDVDFWRQARPSDQRSRDVVLITVTRFSPRKRVDALLRIVAALRPHLPAGVRLKLVVVGDGSLRLYLQRLVAALGLGDVVEMTGYLPRTAIRELFGRAHLFVSACAVESFGLAALEARCAGLPVVARSSGSDQFLPHGRAALLAASDDELARHLLRAIGDPELRQALAQHNRASSSALAPFGWERVIGQHLQVYAQARELVGA